MGYMMVTNTQVDVFEPNHLMPVAALSCGVDGTSLLSLRLSGQAQQRAQMHC